MQSVSETRLSPRWGIAVSVACFLLGAVVVALGVMSSGWLIGAGVLMQSLGAYAFAVSLRA